MKKFYLLLLIALSYYSLSAQTIRYVTAGGTGNGTSWGTASGDLQSMINASASGDQIWVAAGTYKPTVALVSNSGTADPERDKSFALKAGVAIYGGFLGTESALAQRNFISNETILSGDLGGATNADNAFHVVTAYAASSNTRLDGFTISGGNADGDSTNVVLAGGTSTILAARCHGGAINMRGTNSATFANLIIKDNSSRGTGGGVYMYTSSPILDNVTFQNNKSTNGMGGALFCRGTTATTNQCSPTISNSKFIGNSTDASSGGAIQLHAFSKPIFNKVLFQENISAKGAGVIYLNGYTTSSITSTNCTFIDNRANSGAAGVINNYDATGSTFLNCKFIGNYASSNGSVFAFGGSSTSTVDPVITNCIFANNTANGSIYGGVIYNSTFTDGLVANCTFYNNVNSNAANTNNGGAVAFFTSATSQKITLQNSIFNENEGDFYIAATNTGAVLTVKNSLVQTSVANDKGGTNNVVNASPAILFASTDIASVGFLKPLVGSAALDLGDNALIPAGTTTDLAGNARIYNITVDLGAYEFDGENPLPVSLVFYKAAKNGSTALLTWKTASEQNNQKFVIERGTSASNFTFFKEIVGAGNSTTSLNYSVVDYTPLAGTNYYRLTQYDHNGTPTILGVEALTFGLTPEKTTVYPNPAKAYIWVDPSSSNEITSLNLISLTGKNLLTNNYAQTATQGNVKLDLADIPAGTYILWINKGKPNAEKQKLLVVK